MAEHDPPPDPKKSLLTPRVRAAIRQSSPSSLVTVLGFVLRVADRQPERIGQMEEIVRFLAPRLLRQTAHALQAKQRSVESMRRTRPSRLHRHEARLQEMRRAAAEIIEILREDPPLEEPLVTRIAEVLEKGSPLHETPPDV
jgi:coenzyme F420-reducing hydrogenase alpha subunit